jgi:hypothetical protein
VRALGSQVKRYGATHALRCAGDEDNCSLKFHGTILHHDGSADMSISASSALRPTL